MSKKTKKIERRTRGGVPVVPVISYMPVALHRAVKAMAKRQETSQDALINKWAAAACASSTRARELSRKAKAVKEIKADVAAFNSAHPDAPVEVSAP